MDNIKESAQIATERIDLNKLIPHPKNKEIYGDYAEDEIQELQQKIENSGWIKALVVNDKNIIISGHRRWRVAKKLKHETVPIERKQFENELDELEMLLLENENREKTISQKTREGDLWFEIESERAKGRHYEGTIKGGKTSSVSKATHSPENFPESSDTTPPPSEKVKQAEPLFEQETEKAKKRQGKKKSKAEKKADGETRNRVAKRVGMGSGKSYEKAKDVVAFADTLKKEGYKDESIALINALDTESINAARSIIPKLRKPSEKKPLTEKDHVKYEQDKELCIEVLKLLSDGEAVKIKTAKLSITKKRISLQSKEKIKNKPKIDLADFKDWLPKQPQCDLLLTDPPYMTSVDNIYDFATEWLPNALKKVKTTGRAYICIGAYPQEIEAYLAAAKESEMTLANILVWTYRNTLGPAPQFDYKLNWQAILYFRGKDAAPLDCPLMTEQFSVQDITAPDGRFGNREYKWQKPDELAERFIRHSTKQGDLILDPFAGSGTFLLAAAKLGRIAKGCDNDAGVIEIAEGRGCDVV